jgi:hypothetical protein
MQIRDSQSVGLLHLNSSQLLPGICASVLCDSTCRQRAVVLATAAHAVVMGTESG